MDRSTVRVLLVDDDQGDYLMTRAMLEQIEGYRFETEWVPTYQEALDALERHQEFDVFLVDYFLEDHDGLDLVREARSRRIRTPMIMLTGRGSHDVDLEATEAGATDYLVKGRVDPPLLERSIRYALQRHRSEEALRDSEERHRGMFDHLPIGLYRCTPDGAFMDANPTLVRMLGYPDPDTLETRYSASWYVEPGDHARFQDLLERDGVVRGFESVLERVDGVPVRVRNTARLHRAADGTLQYVEGALEDVTELDRAERALGHAEHFRTVFEASGLPILLVDRAGRVTAASPAFHRAFGYGEGEVRGRRLAELVVPDERRAVEAERRQLMAGERHRNASERRLVGAGGDVLWARSLAVVVATAVGAPDHLMLLLEDVAETGETVAR
ncbi:MAG: PAS domain S-box protein [Gemmatimonadetes bacterium]|nr:PAS domain S-box protein [Gemmatimonadota bacterium]